jgi:hypothetical protein
MRGLAQCQMNYLEIVLTKIDKKSKRIFKKERFVNENLKRKRINLDIEDFDILSVIKKPDPFR